jgi:hypothetical protein
MMRFLTMAVKSGQNLCRRQSIAISVVDYAGIPDLSILCVLINARFDDAGHAFLSGTKYATHGCQRHKQQQPIMFPLEYKRSEVNMVYIRPQPPQPDRIRIIRGSFGWIDHRFLRQGFDRELSRLEKLFYFVLIAVSNCDGVSFYSDKRLGEILDIRHAHELIGARNELVTRDLIAVKEKIYQVLDLPSEPRQY